MKTIHFVLLLVAIGSTSDCTVSINSIPVPCSKTDGTSVLADSNAYTLDSLLTDISVKLTDEKTYRRIGNWFGMIESQLKQGYKEATDATKELQ